MAVSKETVAGKKAVLATLSLASWITFPGKTENLGEKPVRMYRPERGQTEHAVLARPFRRELAKMRDTHSNKKATFNGRLTRSGARNASVIVMVTLRTLHFSL
jgi:hypothetical protein